MADLHTRQVPGTPTQQRATASSLHRLTGPAVLFPLIGAALLSVLWATTLNLARLEHDAAAQAARSSTLEIAETYEAQIVRAVREIEQTLALTEYTFTPDDPQATLTELAMRGLLPPAMLFAVTITDRDGGVLASNRPDEAGEGRAVTAPGDGMVSVGRPRWDAGSEQWWLDFSRRLQAAGDGFDGAVTVSADAQYFVSGYEASKLGTQGVLGLLTLDGAFLVRRSGDVIEHDGRGDAVIPLLESSLDDPAVVVVESPWDGVHRYITAHAIFGFPLAVVAGLAQTEQHAAAAARVQTYYWRTAAASALVVLLLTVLGWLSWKLQRAREQALAEHIAHAEQVEYLAFHDGLTGLPNRSFFSKLLSQGIRESRRHQRPLTLMFLDLDRFKIINDTLGHDAGDQLLQEVSRRLRETVRESDVVARLGGDEFVILLPETGGEAQILEVGRKVLNAVRASYTVAGQELRITVSIGVSTYPRDGEDEETLMKNADVAMYHAKESGKNNVQLYSEDLNTSSLERLTLESSLRHALENDEFRMHYQVKRELRSDRITGMEALLRWEHPELGLVAPMQFIPLAEETGLIVPIGRWVLRAVCRQIVEWGNQGLPPLRVAVNLSPRQFMDEDLLMEIGDVIQETGVDPQLLEVEITETSLMRDLGRALVVMRALKQLGIRIAIDDFGTGYSSLSALKQFDLDTIKVDGSFINDLDDNPESQALTEAIIAMGRTLGLTVVAEGVETAGQVKFLRDHACDEFQGFFFNRPMPPDELAKLLTATQAQARAAQ